MIPASGTSTMADHLAELRVMLDKATPRVLGRLHVEDAAPIHAILDAVPLLLDVAEAAREALAAVNRSGSVSTDAANAAMALEEALDRMEPDGRTP